MVSCLLLCVSCIAAALFISSICLRQMLVSADKSASLFLQSATPAIPKSSPFQHQFNFSLALNCHIPKDEIRNFKYFSHNLCIPLKHMKTFFFKYTKCYIDIHLSKLRSIMYIYIYIYTVCLAVCWVQEIQRWTAQTLTLNFGSEQLSVSYPDEQNQPLSI